MRAQIISIGNELLIGDTVNTNASWMGQFLNELGVDVQRVHTISDDKQIISNTIRQCLQESDLVITTGGLGPTHDDITKTTIAELFGVEMRQDEEVLIYIKELLLHVIFLSLHRMRGRQWFLKIVRCYLIKQEQLPGCGFTNKIVFWLFYPEYLMR